MSCLVKIFLPLVVLLVLLPKSALASDNLLQNPDFEQNAGSSFPSWTKNYSTLTLSAASQSGLVHNGSFAALFKSQSTSTKYLYQVILSPSGSYKLSAWLRLLTGNQSGFLRLSWYTTNDGSGSEISSVDSPVIASVGDWQKIEVIGESPSSANSFRAKLVLDPSSTETSELLFDDVTLEKVAASASLTFALTLPSEVEIAEEFLVTINLTGLSPNTKYFAKVLGGQKSKLTGELFDFYTWSPTKNSFLSWNASWSDFPSFVSDSSGTASVTVKGKFASDSFTGENQVVVRLRKDSTSTNLDSDSVSIMVVQSANEESVLGSTSLNEPIVPGPFLTTTSRVLPPGFTSTTPGTQGSELLSTDSGLILAAETPVIPPLALTVSPEKPDPVSQTSSFPWELPLLLVGGLFLAGSLLTMIIRGGGWTFVKGIFLSE